MSEKIMTAGSPWKHILRFSLPVLAGSFLQQLYNTIDAVIVGKYAGEASLAAVGTTGNFIFMIMALALGFSIGNGVVVAQHYGAGDVKGVRRSASSGILFLLILGVVITLVCILIARPVYAGFLSVPDDYLHLTLLYFNIYAVGIIFQCGYNSFASILRSLGDSASTLYFLLIASGLNIALDILFTGVFRWGVAGAAAATDIAQAVSCVAAYVYMRKKYPILRFAPKDYRLDSTEVKLTVKIGLPIAVQYIVISVGLNFVQKAVNEFGQAMTASVTAGSRIEQYMNLPGSALMTSMASYTGQNAGAKKPERIKTGAWQAIVLGTVITGIMTVVVLLARENIIHMFSLSEEAAVYCRQHLKMVALVNLILPLYLPLFGVLQGLGQSTKPLIVSSAVVVARLVTTYTFRYSPVFGYTIVWWNGLFALATACIITWAFYGGWLRGLKRPEPRKT